MKKTSYSNPKKTKAGGLFCLFLSFLTAATAILGPAPAVFADTYSQGEINMDAQCSVTVVKYLDQEIEAYDTDTGIGTTAGVAVTRHQPQNDVKYTIYKIADIEQTKTASGSITLSYKSLLKDSTAAHTTIAMPSGTLTTAALSAWVNAAKESTDPATRASNWSELVKQSGVTGAGGTDGTVVFNNLPVGVYALYEGVRPSRSAGAQSVVLTLPMTAVNDGNDGDSQSDDDVAGDNFAGSASNVGAYWDYDIVVRPKNNLKDITAEKHIVVGCQSGKNILSNVASKQIDETIRFEDYVEVPELIGLTETFFITDTMGEGYTFTDDTQGDNTAANLIVYGMNASTLQKETIPRTTGDNVNYEVACADGVLKIYFNTQALSAPNMQSSVRKQKYTKLWVEYDAKLNSGAIVGGSGNPTDIAVSLSHTTAEPGTALSAAAPIKPSASSILDVINPKSVDATVYTYELDITLSSENGEVSGSKMRLYTADGTKLLFNDFGNQQYVIAKDGDESELTFTADGTVQVLGLASGMYQLVQTKAAIGNALVKDPITVTIVPTSDAGLTFTENASGNYFKTASGKGYYYFRNTDTATADNIKQIIDLTGLAAGTMVNMQDITVYEYALDDPTMAGTAVAKRYFAASSDLQTMAWTSNFGVAADKTIDVSIYNLAAFAVPATGGEGLWIYAVIGGAILVLGVIVLGKRDRQEKQKKVTAEL